MNANPKRPTFELNLGDVTFEGVLEYLHSPKNEERFINSLPPIKKCSLAQQLFEDLVAQCYEAGIIDGNRVAIDSAAIHAYEKKEPKRKSEPPAMLTGELNWIRLATK